MWAAIASLAGSALSGMGKKAGAEASMPYYQGAGNMLNKYLQDALKGFGPYSKAGAEGLGAYQKGLAGMGDPSKFLAGEMAGYHNDPAVKFQISQATNAANARAAASGLGGSSNNLDDVAKITQGLTQQGQQQYLNNLNRIYGQYLGGQRSLAGMGLGAQGDIAGLYGRFGEDQADLAGAEAAAQAAAQGGMLGGLKNLPGGHGKYTKYTNPATFF